MRLEISLKLDIYLIYNFQVDTETVKYKAKGQGIDVAIEKV